MRDTGSGHLYCSVVKNNTDLCYRINQFNIGDLNILVRTQVHAEDHETILEFEDANNSDEEVENGEDFFDIEERGDSKESTPEENGQVTANQRLAFRSRDH